ncbi:MAG: glycosyltransferase family 2 protein [Verrucomicrobia bacterium]|nr:glycosyltransferase family 2 protein [Verrucomicrobiota bacterium]MBU1910364.1 glycosyltransferase family 2 protein [Verrucomicrobiota bacterium]
MVGTTRSNSAPLVVAVVINWNRPQETRDCLRSLSGTSYLSLTILLVDNGSEDDSLESIRREFPAVGLIRNPTNRGFGAAANQGIARARDLGASYVFLLNNDATVAPDALERLVDTADRRGTGAVSPLVLFPETEDRIWSAGARRNPLTLGNMDTRHRRRWRSSWPRILERDYLYGCALLLNLKALEVAGGFDERYFMYFEDMDLCLRLKAAGYALLLDSSARAWHAGAASSGGRGTSGERYWSARSSVLFFRKNARGVQWCGILPWRLFSTVRIMVCLLAAGRRDAAAAYWRGLRDGYSATAAGFQAKKPDGPEV